MRNSVEIQTLSANSSGLGHPFPCQAQVGTGPSSARPSLDVPFLMLSLFWPLSIGVFILPLPQSVLLSPLLGTARVGEQISTQNQGIANVGHRRVVLGVGHLHWS